MMTPRQAFNTRYNGQKYAGVVRYGSAGQYFYALSEETGYYGEPLYGVTVIYKDDVFAYTMKNGCFYSLADAEEYIKEMRKERKL